MKSSDEVVIVSGVRTAIGKFMGSLSGIPAGKSGALVVKAAVQQGQVPVEQIDEVIMGNVIAAGTGQNIARQSVMWAELPNTIPAYTINMVCGSGMMSVIQAARAIRSAEARLVIAGGAENMSAAPYLLQRAWQGLKLGHTQLLDSLVHDGLTDTFLDVHMGQLVDHMAAKFDVSRQTQDEFAHLSHAKAKKAIETGRFTDEIIAVSVPQPKGGTVQFIQDENPRFDCSLEKLASLQPAFVSDGTITAGNSSAINDGASALVLASSNWAEQNGVQRLAKILSWGITALEPALMGMGPIQASKIALQRADLRIEDIDLFEVNEAFAAQCLIVTRELGIPPDLLNVNGGALALGHPIGASGARIIVTLMHEIKKRRSRFGLATLCIGGGMGAALIIENLE